MADPAGFLSRWSRLKQEARQRPATEAEAPEPPAQQPADAPAEELPSVESLTAESDFGPFMQPGVPDTLRNAALQKLWRSDPVYANLDGLVEYGEDFAAEFNAAAVVATVYRVLEGMPGAAVEPAADAAEAPETAAGAAPAESGAAAGTPAAGGGRPASDGVT